MIKIIICLIITFVLNTIDYFQTMRSVQVAGIWIEANPIGRFMLENDLGVLFKLILAPILLTIVGFIARELKRLSGDRELKILSWMIYTVMVLYILVVVNNFIVMFKIGAF